MPGKKKNAVDDAAVAERKRLEQEAEKKRREEQEKRNRELELKRKLREAGDRAATLSIHPNPLHLTELFHREMIDPENPGQTLYEYDGAGSYYCRLCRRLLYGTARHCAESVPPFDLCEPCFQRVKAEETATSVTSALGRSLLPGFGAAPSATPGPDTTPASASLPVSPTLSLPKLKGRDGASPALPARPPTPRSVFREARGGDFARVQELLRPKPRGGGDLFADDTGLLASPEEQAPFDYAVADPATGRTLLHCAASAGAADVLFQLLQHFAVERLDGELDRRDAGGMTPLMVGALEGRVGVVEELLYSEADTRPACRLGYDALMLAASRGHADVAARLLHAGAAVNARSSQGRTPLAIAALNGHCDVARTLLQFRGCDPGIRDDEGYSPVLLAASKGHRDVVALFPPAERRELRW